ncbi:hypothetical protein E2C01_063187 [Portunus trituberculatus]|uniref:Uncharacterized protein n=1 Tax=Portunus trituberculatus TaxID=210409 RepID=A0A5B7HK43_PORTR|nr:hypothetical protein [Portunus trituberculatus]
MLYGRIITRRAPRRASFAAAASHAHATSTPATSAPRDHFCCSSWWG